MSLRIDNLVIEVGRQCNFNCDHCLRGCGENAKIDVETVKSVLMEIDTIDNITFTGGEPCLYQDEIIEIIDFILINNITVYGFYVATNGTIEADRLLLKLAELWGYIGDYFDDEFSKVEISKDMFHEEQTKNLAIETALFRTLRFCGYRKPYGDQFAGLINEGNAKTNGIGSRVLDNTVRFYVSCSDEIETSIDMIYLNAFGELLSCCDLSYESQRKATPPKYEVGKLADILRQYSNEEWAKGA